jgi:hypothetical protein
MSRQILPTKESIKASLEYQYADLYKKLNLTPEQLDEFKDLQAEQMLAQQDMFSNYDFTDDITEEEREEKMEMQLASYTRSNEAYLRAAKSVLSAAQMEKFEAYLEEETERNKLFLEMSTLQESSSGGVVVLSD